MKKFQQINMRINLQRMTSRPYIYYIRKFWVETVMKMLAPVEMIIKSLEKNIFTNLFIQKCQLKMSSKPCCIFIFQLGLTITPPAPFIIKIIPNILKRVKMQKSILNIDMDIFGYKNPRPNR